VILLPIGGPCGRGPSPIVVIWAAKGNKQPAAPLMAGCTILCSSAFPYKLAEPKPTYNEPVTGTLTKFDGTPVTICGKDQPQMW
jgi:hypothetical protein